MVKKNFLKSSLVIAAVVAMIVAFLPISSVNATGETVKFQSHIQGIGWQSSFLLNNAVHGGTEGQSKRLEAIKISTVNLPATTKLSYRVHVQGYGWMDWANADTLAGTEGESKRMEAIEISVEGLTGFVIRYRAHVQGIGWQDWVVATNSKAENKAVPTVFAGTSGESKRIEALEIKVVSVAQNDLELLKEQAIKTLEDEFSANLYTINADAYKTAMDNAKKAINEVDDAGNINKTIVAQRALLAAIKTDAQEAADLEKAKIAAVNQLDLYVGAIGTTKIKGSTSDKNLYVKRPAIVKAVNDAKALIRSCNSSEDLVDVVKEARLDILYAVADEVNIIINDLYNDNALATKDSDKILPTDKYNAGVKAVETAISAAEAKTAPDGSDLIALVNAMETTTYGASGANMKTLSAVRTEFETGLNNFNDDIYGKGTIVTAETHTEGQLLGLRSSTETYFSGLKAVTTLLNTKKQAINESKSYAEMEKLDKEARDGVLDAIQAYMKDVVRLMQVDENASGYILGASKVTAKFNELANSEKIEDLAALITEYTAVLSGATKQNS